MTGLRSAARWALLLVFGGGAAACRPPPEPAADSGVAADAADAAPAASAPIDAAPADVPSAPAPSAPSGPIAAGQTWSGSYTCGSAKPTHLSLHVKAVSGSSVDAVFDFTTDPQKQKGEFTMHGTLSGKHLSLAFGKWLVQPAGFVPADLNGTLSDDGHGYSGSVIAPAASCKTFSVRR